MDQEQLDNLDWDQLEDVAILNGNGVLKAGYKLVDRKPDQNGLVAVVDANERLIKVHPSRVAPGAGGGAVLIEKGEGYITVCPHCRRIIPLPTKTTRATCGECNAACDVHEYVDLRGATLAAPDKKPPTKRAPNTHHGRVEYSELAKMGELWVKEGISFGEDTSILVAALSLRVGDRYVSLNLYNNSFGKNPTKAEQLLERLKQGADGPRIYKIQSVAKWRRKLQKLGYCKYEEGAGAH